jgi:methylenetetrahydrofolate dehydrogenase (NADP+)/methenyltetrahydrofolate cyclohydrolase
LKFFLQLKKEYEMNKPSPRLWPINKFYTNLLFIFSNLYSLSSISYYLFASKKVDGTQVAETILTDVTSRVRGMPEKPHLVIICCGDTYYAGLKKQRCDRCGIGCQIRDFDAQVCAEDLERYIGELNERGDVTGIVLMSPLPEGLRAQEAKIRNLIDPKKDIDGLTEASLSKLRQNCPQVLRPPHAQALIEILQRNSIDLFRCGNILLVTGGQMLGNELFINPLKIIFRNMGLAFDEVAYSASNLKETMQTADVVISACGIQEGGFIPADYVREAALVVDCGIPGDFYQSDTLFEKIGTFIPPRGGVALVSNAVMAMNLLLAWDFQLANFVF